MIIMAAALTTSTPPVLTDQEAVSMDALGDTLLWNHQGVLSNLLMMEEHYKNLSPEDIPHAWCMPPGELVYTSAGISEIQDVTLLSEVRSYLGINRVTNVMHRPYSGDLIVVQPYYSNTPLKMTPEHPVLVSAGARRKGKKWGDADFEAHLTWKPAGELTDEDLLVFPRKTTNIFMPLITDELCELIGLYLAEGSVSAPSSIYFWIGQHETELKDHIVNLWKNLGEDPVVIPHKSCWCIAIWSKKWYSLFQQFGEHSHEKKLPEWALYLPSHEQRLILKGHLSGDGNEEKRSFRHASTSRTLVYQLRLILFNLGILHGVYNRGMKNSVIDGREIIAKHDIYEICVGGDGARAYAEQLDIEYDGGKRTAGSYGKVTDDAVYIPIKEITREPYLGVVYNLSVDNAESYLTPHGVVHNCIVKHYLLAKDHHAEEAIGHAERLGLMEEAEKYRAFREKLKKLPAYPQPAFSLAELLELRTEWRKIIGDPTLVEDCPLCAADVSPGTLESLKEKANMHNPSLPEPNEELLELEIEYTNKVLETLAKQRGTEVSPFMMLNCGDIEPSGRALASVADNGEPFIALCPGGVNAHTLLHEDEHINDYRLGKCDLLKGDCPEDSAEAAALRGLSISTVLNTHPLGGGSVGKHMNKATVIGIYGANLAAKAIQRGSQELDTMYPGFMGQTGVLGKPSFWVNLIGGVVPPALYLLAKYKFGRGDSLALPVMVAASNFAAELIITNGEELLAGVTLPSLPGTQGASQRLPAQIAPTSTPIF